MKFVFMTLATVSLLREDTGAEKLVKICKSKTRVNEVYRQSNDAIFQVTSFTRYMGLKVLKLGEFYHKN